jgi:hypothetical protein
VVSCVDALSVFVPYENEGWIVGWWRNWVDEIRQTGRLVSVVEHEVPRFGTRVLELHTVAMPIVCRGLRMPHFMAHHENSGWMRNALRGEIIHA